ncbi:MAG: phytanoyl-CoA dioxygenase family protein, partial [Geminicoccaceae bacterium]
PEEMELYRRDGLVRPDLAFAPDELKGIRTLLDATLAATAGRRPESIVCPHIASMNDLSSDLANDWLQLCTLPRLLDLVQQAIGPDIVLWGSQIFCKPADTGLAVPWHQDGHFWPIRPLATCSVWIAIDDVTLENGAMQFIPGSQRERRLFDHVRDDSKDSALNATLAADQFDLAAAAVDDLKAGALSLHDVFLIHGSEPNRSNKRRAAFVIRYMPATSHFDRSEAKVGSQHVPTRLAEREIYLVRGEDWTGKINMVDLRASA